MATAKLFVKEGAHVFITGRRQKELNEAVKAIGANVSGVQGDVAQSADLDRLYETVAKVTGRIDIVFAHAGVGEFVPFGAVTEEHFDKLFNIIPGTTEFLEEMSLSRSIPFAITKPVVAAHTCNDILATRVVVGEKPLFHQQRRASRRSRKCALVLRPAFRTAL